MSPISAATAARNVVDRYDVAYFEFGYEIVVVLRTGDVVIARCGVGQTLELAIETLKDIFLCARIMDDEADLPEIVSGLAAKAQRAVEVARIASISIPA